MKNQAKLTETKLSGETNGRVAGKGSKRRVAASLSTDPIKARNKSALQLETLKTQAQVLESMAEGVIMADEHGIISYANPAFEVMFGYDPDELIGQHVSILNEGSLPDLERHFLEITGHLERSGAWSDEFLNRRKDGTLFYTHARITAMDIAGKKHLISVQDDITDKKRAEEALQKAHADLELRVAGRTAKLASSVNALKKGISERERITEALRKSAVEIQDLYDNAPCGYHSLNKDGVIIRINATELKWLGYTQDEVVGRMKLPDLMTDRGKQLFAETFPRLKREGRINNLEQEFVRKDGTILPVSLSATVLYDKDGNFVMSRSTTFDITDRKEAEQKLLRLNRLYAVLSQTGKAIVHAGDQFAMFREICRIAVEHGGFRLAWVGLADRQAGSVNVETSHGETAYLENIRISCRDEPEGCGPTGTVVRKGGFCVINDFMADPCIRPWHERARAHGLKASAAIALKRDQEVLGALTLYAGEKGFFDPQMVELLQQMGQDISFALENLEREARRKRTEAALQAEIEERLRTAEELRLKDRLMMQQGRLAAMGEMIGNIAHQWRQPLNTLGLVVQRIGFFYKTGGFNREFLENSTDEAMRLIQHMSRTIDDFRDFFRTDKEKVVFDVNQAIRQTVALVEMSYRDERIAVSIKNDGNPRINGYPNEYSQVILSILHNARDAFAERAIDNALVSINSGMADDKIVVTITDNAGGIPEEIMDKIFDPYFTTKGPDKGTGIGLFMAKNIIENSMGGRLTVRNTGNGAEFRIEA